jgi:hypothetical protein
MESSPAADRTGMRRMLKSPYVGLFVSVVGFSLGGGAALLRTRSNARY